MNPTRKISSTAVATALAACLGGGQIALMSSAHAVNPMNMMNPSKWFGGDRDRDRYYDDDYYYDRYRRWGGPYGWGGGPYGWGGSPYGWGGPGYGYGGRGGDYERESAPPPPR